MVKYNSTPFNSEKKRIAFNPTPFSPTKSKPILNMYGRKSRGKIFYNPDASMSSCPSIASEIHVGLSENKANYDTGAYQDSYNSKQN